MSSSLFLELLELSMLFCHHPVTGVLSSTIFWWFFPCFRVLGSSPLPFNSFSPIAVPFFFVILSTFSPFEIILSVLFSLLSCRLNRRLVLPEASASLSPSEALRHYFILHLWKMTQLQRRHRKMDRKRDGQVIHSPQPHKSQNFVYFLRQFYYHYKVKDLA